jgi:hypothetical protein
MTNPIAEIAAMNRKPLEKTKRRLIDQAHQRYGKVRPCHSIGSWDGCFARHDDKLVLWFDTSDGSTHLVSQPLEG